MTGWVPDVLPGYRQRTIGLGPDPDGEGYLVATPVRRGDGVAVLDVAQIARWAGCIGNRTTVVPVALRRDRAKHDVFLSLPQPRQVAYHQLDICLEEYLSAAADADVPARNG